MPDTALPLRETVTAETPERFWFPHSRPTPVLEQAGVCWSAVRMPVEAGELVLEALGDDCGPVIQDPQHLYFLVKRDVIDRTSRPGVVLLPDGRPGMASHIAVPPAYCRSGSHSQTFWRRDPYRPFASGDLVYVAIRSTLPEEEE